jgi:hypothetical protein
MQKQNSPFLQLLYDSCRNLGLVQNQYEFSKLCGRKTTWFSASKSRDLPLSKNAAVQLSIKLKHKADTDLPRKLQPTARRLSNMLMDHIIQTTLEPH